MDLKEANEKLSYHRQAAAAWEQFAKHARAAGEDAAHHISVELGVHATRVGSPCLEEIRTFMLQKRDEHSAEADRLERIQISPIQLAPETPQQQAQPTTEEPAQEDGGEEEEGDDEGEDGEPEVQEEQVAPPPVRPVPQTRTRTRRQTRRPNGG